VTGNAASASDPVGTEDVDGGRTILTSPVFDLSGMAHPTVGYWRFYTNNAGSNPNEDILHVELSNDGGSAWVSLENVSQSSSQWVQVIKTVDAHLQPTSQMRVRFIAEDLGGGSVVEAAIDDFMAYDAVITDAPPRPGFDRLHANYPNPFNPSTRIRFELARTGPVAVRIYDVQGRLVRRLFEGRMPAGVHESPWNGRTDRGVRAASGVYLVRMSTAGSQMSRRVVLAK
jgi:hypothetical protein